MGSEGALLDERKNKLKTNKKGSGEKLIQGLGIISEFSTTKIRNIKKGRRYLTVPSSFRTYSVTELYQRLLVLLPDYKGKYAFAYSEFGFGFDLGISVDIAKLLLSPLVPLELEVKAKGGGDKFTESLILLSRPAIRKQGKLSQSLHGLTSSFPICLQTFSGHKYNIRVSAGVSAGIKITPPISIGLGELSFSIAEVSARLSANGSKYYLQDTNPGWYEHKQSRNLMTDISNLHLGGLKKGLKEEVIRWLKDHVLKNIIEHLIAKHQDVPTLSDIKREINNLPERTFYKRIKQGQVPFKNHKSIEIKDGLTTIKRLFEKEEIKGEYFKNHGEKAKIIEQIRWYIKTLNNAKVVSDQVLNSNSFPKKEGSINIDNNNDAFLNLCFAEMTTYGPFQFQMNANLIKSSFKYTENENSKEDEDNDEINRNETWYEVVEQEVKNKTKVQFDKYITGPLKNNTISILKNLSFNAGLNSTLSKTTANSKYQSFAITSDKESPIVFTQEVKIEYLLSNFIVSEKFGVVEEEEDSTINLNEEANKLQETIDASKTFVTNLATDEEGVIKQEIIEGLQWLSKKIDGKTDEKIEEIKDITGINKKLKELKEKAKEGKYKNEKHSVGNNKELSLHAGITSSGFDFNLTFAIRKIEYYAISAFWKFPKSESKKKNTVLLKEGSGISYGFSIQLSELTRLANNYQSYKRKNTISEENITEFRSFNGEVSRIASLLKLKEGVVKEFLENLFQLIKEDEKGWNEVIKNKELLLESSHRFSKEKEVKLDFELDKATIQNLLHTETTKASEAPPSSHFSNLFKGDEIKKNYKDFGLVPESIRLRYRIADSNNNNQAFSLGVDVGIGLNLSFKKYKKAGNEAIQDFLICLIPPDGIEESEKEKYGFFYEQFPSEYLDRSVPPVILLPHSFPDSE